MHRQAAEDAAAAAAVAIPLVSFLFLSFSLVITSCEYYLSSFLVRSFLVCLPACVPFFCAAVYAAGQDQSKEES